MRIYANVCECMRMYANVYKRKQIIEGDIKSIL